MLGKEGFILRAAAEDRTGAANTTAHRSSAEQTPALLAALKYDTKGNLTLHKFHSWFIQVWEVSLSSKTRVNGSMALDCSKSKMCGQKAAIP